MKIVSHTSEELNNIIIENPQVYDILSSAVKPEEDDDEGGSLLQSLN